MSDNCPFCGAKPFGSFIGDASARKNWACGSFQNPGKGVWKAPECISYIDGKADGYAAGLRDAERSLAHFSCMCGHVIRHLAERKDISTEDW